MFISNTSTLVLLAKIGLLHEFLDNAPNVIIPKDVEKEVMAKTSFDAQLIAKEIDNGRIEVKNANIQKIKSVLGEFHLGLGEAAAYALYESNEYLAILTDDGELIKLCKLERIPFICAMAVVVRLNEKKVLTKKEALDKLEQLVIIGHYAQSIYDHFKKEVK
ncbi:MAG: hypothetical protein ACE5FT_06770 [Candidatus Nanoarchaeia archaeon]